MNIMKSQANYEKKFLEFNGNDGCTLDLKSKKVQGFLIAEFYNMIGDSLKQEYASRGVHTEYTKKLVRKAVFDVYGNIRQIVKQVKSVSKGLFDKDGKRVINWYGRAKRMFTCSSFLEFLRMKDGRMKLVFSNSCRDPLCPFCQFKRSLKMFIKIMKIMELVKKEHSDCQPVFLTLTTKNCSVNDLKPILKYMSQSWNRFICSRTFNPRKDESFLKGWFRCLEVTYNYERDEFHPHYHVVLLVDKKLYFSKEHDNYMKCDEWATLWGNALKLNENNEEYTPYCYVKKISNMVKGAAYVAKYSFKTSEILDDRKIDVSNKARVIQKLLEGMYCSRRYAFGGIMKEYAAQIESEKGEYIVDFGADDVLAVEKYRWDYNLCEYVLYCWFYSPNVVDSRTGELLIDINSTG